LIYAVKEMDVAKMQPVERTDAGDSGLLNLAMPAWYLKQASNQACGCNSVDGLVLAHLSERDPTAGIHTPPEHSEVS
jgi:hypothetical protein